MSVRAANFMKRKKIDKDSIKYILRENAMTVLYLLDGRTFTNATPMKEFLEELTEVGMVNIQKGICVSKNYIVHISDDGIYTMSDNRTFQGRRRYLKEHKAFRNSLSTVAKRSPYVPHQLPARLADSLSIVDGLPLPYLLVQLIFDSNHAHVDYVIRYCNDAFGKTFDCTSAEIVGSSIYDVFPEASEILVASFGDAILNGISRSVFYTSQTQKKDFLVALCQPHEGFSACMFTELSHSNMPLTNNLGNQFELLS